MPLTIAALQQVVEQNDQKNEDAHKRLRVDLRDNEQAVYELEKQVRELTVKMERLLNAPAPDVTTLRFPLPIVAAIAAGFLTIGGGILKSQYDLSSLRTEVLNRLDSTSAEHTNQIQNLKETIIRLDQQQRLQYAEFQTFRQEMARSSKR